MNIEKAQAKRREDHLAKLVRFKLEDGREITKTRKEFVEHRIRVGKYRPHTWVENKIKDMSRMAFFRASGEDQRAHEKRQREAGLKTCYGLQHPGGSLISVVSKIEYDYAITLLQFDEAA